MNNYNLAKLEEKINKCKNQKIEEIDENEIDELSDINIDRKKKGNERILDFINKISNPYIFKIKGKVVKIEFTNSNVDAEESLANIISSLYR